MLAAVGAAGRHVVVTVEGLLEETPSRLHAVARRVVGAADRLVVCAPGHPVGVRCLSQWAVDAREVADLARTHVALMDAASEQTADLGGEIRRLWQPAAVVGLPLSDRQRRAACWACELPTTGRWVRAVGRLAEVAVPRLEGAAARQRTAAWTAGSGRGR